jgi:hypothetical protein
MATLTRSRRRTLVPPSETTRRRRWWWAAAAVPPALFGPTVWRAVYRQDDWVGTNDMPTHLEMAEGFGNPLDPNIPHFLFHAPSRALGLLPGLSTTDGAFLVLLAGLAAGGLALFWLARTPIGARPPLAPSLAFLTALVVALADSPAAFGGPESFETRTPDYLPAHTYFNPTAIVLFPLAVVALVLGARALASPDGDDAPPRVWWTASAALAAGTLAKPALTITLLPAGLLLLALVARSGRLTRATAWSRAVRWSLVVGLPSAALLAWQYQVVTVGVAEDLQGGMTLDPFWVVQEFGFLNPRFWLVLALPILLVAGHRWWPRVDPPVALALLALAVGLVYLLFLRETGIRGYWAPNFFWTVQTAGLLLWALSFRFLAYRLVDLRTVGTLGTRGEALSMALALQVACVGLAIGTKLTLCSTGMTAAC